MRKNHQEIPIFHKPVTSTTRGFAAPWCYVQGPGEFDKLPQYAAVYSDRVFALIDCFLYGMLGDRLNEAFAKTNLSLYIDRFGGECCQSEIDRVIGLIRKQGASLAIAIGGGKTLDTVKVAAITLGIHLIIVPTAASNDAPVSALAVIYTPEGVHDHSVTFHRGSDMVLVDSEIVMKAPRRLLVAGMGDALSTYFEAKACYRKQVKNGVNQGYLPCMTAMAIAKLSYETLMKDSTKALLAQENGIINEAFENILEVNVLMSGLGFENTGCSLAHAVNAGLSELKEAAPYLHGERVGFGVLVQLAFENADIQKIRGILKYMVSVGLPVTLRQLGVENTPEKIEIMAKKMVYHSGLAHTQSKVVNMDTVSAAIRMADALGEAYRTDTLPDC